MGPQTFIKKTTAMQWDGSERGVDDIGAWLATFSAHKPVYGTGTFMSIDGQPVTAGDYVIRNMVDYPHVIKRAAFESTYEAA